MAALGFGSVSRLLVPQAPQPQGHKNVVGYKPKSSLTTDPQAMPTPDPITECRLEVGSLDWFFRQGIPPIPTDHPPVILLHGLISQSYGWIPLMQALVKEGYHVLAPDWLGCGFSAKPERWEFSYRPEDLAQALGDWIHTLEIPRFSLVVQGYLGACVMPLPTRIRLSAS